jgi:hypothetical protein
MDQGVNAWLTKHLMTNFAWKREQVLSSGKNSVQWNQLSSSPHKRWPDRPGLPRPASVSESEVRFIPRRVV